MMMVRFGSVNAVIFFREGKLLNMQVDFYRGAYKETGRL